MEVKQCLSQVFETRVQLAKLIDQRLTDTPPSDLDEQIYTVWAEYVEQYVQARKLIQLFPDMRMRNIFILRYLLFVKWEYIAEDVGLKAQRLFDLHAQGIKQLKQTVDNRIVTETRESP